MNNIDNSTAKYRIPAAWEPCDALVLVWPDESSSDELIEFYEAMASVLPDYADLVILPAEGKTADLKNQLELLNVSTEYISFQEIPAVNINIGKWGPIIAESAKEFLLFKQENDNSDVINSGKTLFPYADPKNLDFQIENGMLESDGVNLLLLNKKHWIQNNPQIEFSQFEDFLQNNCGIENIIVVGNFQALDYLPIRIAPGNRLLKTTCNDTSSTYYQDFYHLQVQLQEQLKDLSFHYEVIDLPWIGDLTDEQGHKYFADYSQFLILNEAVVVPLFNLPTDEDAMEILSQVFPGFEILGFPSSALAIANTNLHKISLPVPEGVLEPLYD